MSIQKRDIPTLAAEFTAAHPNLDPSQQRLVLATFRMLGEGQPFGPAELAERTGRPLDEVASHLDNWPDKNRDDQGRVTAIGGLSLTPTTHTILVNGRTLYAWCALDTLFLPELLGEEARVRSTSPGTGETITLTVDAQGPRDVAPQDAVMTLHSVSGADLDDAVGTFCCYVNFFASEEAARTWAEQIEGSYVVSIAEGFEYGRLFNQGWLGEALRNEAP